MIDEMFIIELMKEEKSIDMNNMMKDDMNLEDFDNDQRNERFSDEIDLKMNDNNDNYWNKEFFDEIELNINNDDNKFVINH